METTAVHSWSVVANIVGMLFEKNLRKTKGGKIQRSKSWMICGSKEIQKDPKNSQLNRNQIHKSKGSTEKQMNPKRIKDCSEREGAGIQKIVRKI